MTQEEINNVADEPLIRHHRRHGQTEPFRDEGRFRTLRFWLNVIFMVAAAAGMIIWFTDYREFASYLLIGAMVPKFIEVTLRIMKL
jgi:hypothetical protein